MENIHKQIHNHLQHARHTIIVTHQNPDGDALGAASAMAEYLRNLNKQAVIFCASPVPSYMSFLPHVDGITADPDIFRHPDNDTVLVLDSGDLRYAGVDKLVDAEQITLINIDHHHTNAAYGHLNLVNSQAASTTEILFHFFRHNRIRLNRHKATALLTGIMTDTGNFTNSATSPQAVTIAGELLRAGANLNLINKWTIRNNSVNMLKLWGKVLARLEHKQDKDLAYTYLTKEDYRQFSIKEKEIDGIANFMNNIGNIKIGLFLKETEDGMIKGSFRTSHDDVDVSALAKQLGGGGHKKAAGFTTKGTIEQIIDKILTMEKKKDIIKKGTK